jgi:hypothetical protein
MWGRTIEKDCHDIIKIRRGTRSKNEFVWLTFGVRSKILFNSLGFSESTILDLICTYFERYVRK